jgi:phosphatidylglycerophosphatase A
MSTSATLKIVFSDAGHFIAFGGGAGLSRFAPGTIGALLALPLFYLGGFVPGGQSVAAAAGLFIVGVPLCGRACRALGVDDDSGVVYDEIAGCFLALCLCPRGFWWGAAAFVFFRFFDIIKPPPIAWLDKNIKGGLGVMADDAAAALAAAAVVNAIAWAV